jgi:hypothetical protein
MTSVFRLAISIKFNLEFEGSRQVFVWDKSPLKLVGCSLWGMINICWMGVMICRIQ